jgi:WD40 repeat protein
VSSGPEGGGYPIQVEAETDGRYSVDARGGMGVQVGEGNTQIIYSYNRLTWTDGVAPPPLVGVSGTIDSPYRGLGAFEERDAAFFFGRETAATELLERMSRLLAGNDGLLVVSGVSGAGKSSLLRAGVLPRFRGTGLASAPGSESWPCLVFTPGHAPLDELALRVALLAGLPAADVRRGLSADPGGFALTVRQAALAPLPGLAGGSGDREAGWSAPRLLLVVDQFEQVFTQCADEWQREAFITALCAAAGAGPDGVRASLVVLGVRADFEARCADYPQLAGAVQDRYLVMSMTDRQIRMAITEPAREAGSRVDEDLVEVLAASARSGPSKVAAAGLLPLLSHALDQAWRSRAGEALTLADYERTGGIEVAVARSAQRAYDSLNPSQQSAARQVFTRLTATSSDGTDTADRATRVELMARRDPGAARDVETVLTAFAAERLLTLAADTVEISHEVLLTAWPLLRDTWLAETHADRIVRTRLHAVTAEWEHDLRDSSYLYSGSLLDSATETVARIEADPRHAPLSRAESDFLRASHQDGRRRARGRRQVIAVLLALIAGLTAMSAAAVGADREAVSEGGIAAAQRDVAAARLLISESEATGDANATVSDIESTAAWTIDPSAQSRAALLADAASPETATITASDDVGVNSVAVSPDGKILATGSATVQLWDIATRRQLEKPLAATGVLGFIDNGKLLITDNSDVVQVWDVASARKVARISPAVSGALFEAALSHGGSTLATATGTTAGAVLRLWDMATRQPVGRPVKVHPFPSVLRLSPDGKTLATGSMNGAVRLWRITAGQIQPGPVLSGTGNTKDVYSAAFSPDGRTIATGEREGLYPVAFNSDGQTNTAGEKDASVIANDRVQLWDVASGRRIGNPFTNAVDGDYALAFSPDGTMLAAGGADGTVRVVSPADGRLIAGPFISSGGAVAIAFSPDGGTLATGNPDGTARLWDMASAASRQIGTGAPIYTVSYTWAAFTPGGKTLVTVTGNGVMQVWDVATGRQIDKTPLFWTRKYGFVILSPGVIALSPNGAALATGGVARVSKAPHSPQIGVGELWHVVTGQVGGAAHPPGVAQLRQLAFTPNGRTLIAVTGPSEAHVWDLATNARGRPLHVAGAYALRLTQDGVMLAVSSVFGPVRLLADATGKQVGRPLAAHFGPISWLALSPHGETLAVGVGNGAAQLLNVATGRLISRMSGANGVTSAVFSPDGAVLATFAAGSRGNGPVRLWDVASGQPIGGPVGGNGSAALAFSPDGRMLAIVSDDGAVQLWDVSYFADPLTELCARIGGSIPPAQWTRYVPPGPAYRNVCAPAHRWDLGGWRIPALAVNGASS